MKAKLLFIQSLSPLHAGTGQGVGVIDQPIAREKATNIPYLPGSSIKGVFRDACQEIPKVSSRCDAIFGTAVEGGSGSAGSVSFSDARLLLLPVRSLAGVFAWVTSPLILHRFQRDLQSIAFEKSPPKMIPQVGAQACLVCDPTALHLQTGESTVVLEEIKLSASNSTDLGEWAAWLGPMLFSRDADWQKILTQRLCLVPDDVFSFLLEIGTQVTARIRIDDDKKTVKEGALWYEEALPVEAVLASLVVASNVSVGSQEVFSALESILEKYRVIQFGGSATVGFGLCQVTLVPGEVEK